MEFDRKKLPPPPLREAPKEKTRLVLKESMRRLEGSEPAGESGRDKSTEPQTLEAWENKLREKEAQLGKLEAQLAEREARLVRHEIRLQKYAERFHAA